MKTKLIKKGLLFIFVLTGFLLKGYAQGKYFEVITAAYTTSFGNDKFYGRVVPAGKPNGSYATLNFAGKTKNELYKAVMAYLENRPTLALKPQYTTADFIAYRDFAVVGSMDTCFADLVALTYVGVIPEDGVLKVDVGGVASKIFASIFKAKLQITPDDNVASIGDQPFNEYKFVQPADEGVLHSRSRTRSMLLGSGVKTVIRSLKEAYPDSIFDPEGRVINPINKKIIESYYDGYAADLNQFVQAFFKKVIFQ